MPRPSKRAGNPAPITRGAACGTLLPTSAGPHLAFAPRPLAFPSNPAAARALAADLDRRAILYLAEGRRELADRLAHAAFECRARAGKGSRAGPRWPSTLA